MEPGQLLQPDRFVVGTVAGRIPREWSECGVPLLVVEVLSPSTARYDRVIKRAFYQRAGVPACWIVDVDARVVECWRPLDQRPRVETEKLTWRPERDSEDLVIELDALFREVHGDP